MCTGSFRERGRKKRNQRCRTQVTLRKNISKSRTEIFPYHEFCVMRYHTRCSSATFLEREFRSELVAEFVIQINKKTRKSNVRILFETTRRTRMRSCHPRFLCKMRTTRVRSSRYGVANMTENIVSSRLVSPVLSPRSHNIPSFSPRKISFSTVARKPRFFASVSLTTCKDYRDVSIYL